MNLSIIARVLRQLAIIFVLSVLLVAGYIYYAGKQHQQAAINFWGEQYQPDAISTQIDWGFIGNWVIPRGGPIISVTNGAIVIHTQRLKSDPGGNLLS
ncbi:hypothetical protein ODQ96_25075 [Escherichia coli]|nr:hypothetical protein [Escherichia coli]